MNLKLRVFNSEQYSWIQVLNRNVLAITYLILWVTTISRWSISFSTKSIKFIFLFHERVSLFWAVQHIFFLLVSIGRKRSCRPSLISYCISSAFFIHLILIIRFAGWQIYRALAQQWGLTRWQSRLIVNGFGFYWFDVRTVTINQVIDVADRNTKEIELRVAGSLQK